MNSEKNYKKEIFTLPNILSFFRLILIPIFAYKYIMAESPKDYYMSAGILTISVITDFLDGKIARRFNMISELGKALDPIADKLTHIVIAICLIKKYQIVLGLVILMILKESYMIFMGMYFMKTRNKKLDGAKMFGKVCTTIAFLVLLILVLVPEINNRVVSGLVSTASVAQIVTWFMYIPVFNSMRN